MTSEPACACSPCEAMLSTGRCLRDRGSSHVDHAYKGDSSRCDVHGMGERCGAIAPIGNPVCPFVKGHEGLHKVNGLVWDDDHAPQPTDAPAAVGVLTELEWCMHGDCPVCDGIKPELAPDGADEYSGHAPKCRLKAAIEAEDSARTTAERIVYNVLDAATILKPDDTVKAVNLITTAIIADREQAEKGEQDA